MWWGKLYTTHSTTWELCFADAGRSYETTLSWSNESVATNWSCWKSPDLSEMVKDISSHRLLHIIKALHFTSVRVSLISPFSCVDSSGISRRTIYEIPLHKTKCNVGFIVSGMSRCRYPCIVYSILLSHHTILWDSLYLNCTMYNCTYIIYIWCNSARGQTPIPVHGSTGSKLRHELWRHTVKWIICDVTNRDTVGIWDGNQLKNVSEITARSKQEGEILRCPSIAVSLD